MPAAGSEDVGNRRWPSPSRDETAFRDRTGIEPLRCCRALGQGLKWGGHGAQAGEVPGVLPGLPPSPQGSQASLPLGMSAPAPHPPGGLSRGTGEGAPAISLAGSKQVKRDNAPEAGVRSGRRITSVTVETLPELGGLKPVTAGSPPLRAGSSPGTGLAWSGRQGANWPQWNRRSWWESGEEAGAGGTGSASRTLV